jgi:hypothetical protein
MASPAITNLRRLYETRVEALTNALDQAKAYVALDAWEKAETQYQEILEASAQSYSTSGRSVTKRDIGMAEQARNVARAELDGAIGGPDGGVCFVDNGGRIW